MNNQEEIEALKKRLAELESIDQTCLVKINGKPMKIQGQYKLYEGHYSYDKKTKKQIWISPINIIEVSE